MNKNNNQRLNKLINLIENKKITLSVQEYPDYLENEVQLAVQNKRVGNYDKAIEKYLDIFDNENTVWAEMMLYLYKVLLVDNELFYAYKVVMVSEKMFVDGYNITAYKLLSMFKNPFPDIQRILNPSSHRCEYIESLRKAINEDDYETISNYIKRVSGDPCYELKLSYDSIRDEADRILTDLSKNKSEYLKYINF